MSAQAARSDPSWNPSIAGRELLKPKFYDVWFGVSGKKEAMTRTTHVPTGVKDGVVVRDIKTPEFNLPRKIVRKEGQPTKHKVETSLKEMQRLMQVQLQVRHLISAGYSSSGLFV